LLYDQLNVLAKKEESRGEAVRKAREGAKVAAADHAQLSARRTALAEEARGKKVPLDLVAADRRLKDVEKAQTDLTKFAVELEGVQEQDAKQRDWKSRIARGLSLEKQLEYDEALKVYKDVLAEDPGNKDLEKHIGELERVWKTDDEGLKAARRFIYGDW